MTGTDRHKGDHEEAERWLLLMGDVGRRVHDAMSRAVEDKELVTNSVVAVLCALDLSGPSRPGRLCDLTGLSSAGMTGLLDRLEDRGLIRRSGLVEGDRRGVNVKLTPAGRKTIRTMSRAAGAEVDYVRVFAKSLAREVTE